MKKRFKVLMRDLGFVAVGLSGVSVLTWVAAGFTEGQPLAFAVTAMIAIVFLVGMTEIWRWRRLTVSLAVAVAAAQEAGTEGAGTEGAGRRLEPWLDAVPASLRGPLRARVEGERLVLPALAMTPYLIGLLVMLGMLGTFLGMVVTLKGATLALGSTTDLDLIRAALAEPIRGLGLSFGTSVAGVASSALLGLASMLARRERAESVSAVEVVITGYFHAYSPAAQRQKTLELLTSQHAVLEAQRRLIEAQQGALPGVAERLIGLAGTLESSGLRLATTLESNGRSIATMLETSGRDLATTLETSGRDLATTLESSSRDLAATLESSGLKLAATLETSFASLSDQLQKQNEHLLDATTAGWQRLEAGVQAALRESIADGGRQAGESLRPVIEAATRAMVDDVQALRKSVLESTEARLQAISGQLATQADNLARTWSDSALQCSRELDTGLRALMETLSEQHERELTARAERQLARDNDMVARQSVLIQTVDGLASSVGDTLSGQSVVIGQLVARSSELLDAGLGGMGERLEAITTLVATHVKDTQAMLTDRVAVEAARLELAAAQAAAGAAEVGTVANVFADAVLRFGEGTDRLLARLVEIQTALQQSSTRSDEQLAYYVAQAREIIDLTLLSQKQLLERLPSSSGLPRHEGAAGQVHE